MHDSTYKLLFSHSQMIEDLLRGFVPGDWVARLDFATLEKLNASFVSDDLRQRHDDVIWRVRFQDQWLYVLLLLEFQSSIDPFMGVRIQTYIGLLYQDLVRGKALSPRGKLPPVFPIVLYNGDSRWTAALDVNALIEPVRGDLATFQPSQRYLLIDEGRFKDRDLPPSQNLVAALIRLENSQRPEDIPPVLDALIEWLHDPAQRDLKRAFTEWIVQVLLPARLPGIEVPQVHELTEVKTMLAERVKEWTTQWKQEGLEAGRQQGRQQGRQEGIEEMLEQERQLLVMLARHKFGDPVATALAGRMADLDDQEQLTEIGKMIIQCARGKDFLAGLPPHQ